MKEQIGKLLLVLGLACILYSWIPLQGTAFVLDNCDTLTDDWGLAAEGTLEISTSSPYEGAGNIKAFILEGWQPIVYRRGLPSMVDTPIISYWVRVQSIPQDIPDFQIVFDIVTREEWVPSHYRNIVPELTPGEWCRITVDLRYPAEGEPLPDLSVVRQMSWTINYQASTQIFNFTFEVDLIQLHPSETPALTCELSPSSASLTVGETQTFVASVSGGSPPYSFQWFLDNEMLPETEAQYTFTATSEGGHILKVIVTDSNGTRISNTATIYVASSGSTQPPEETTYVLIIESGEGGTTTPTAGTYTYSKGETVTIHATPNENYVFCYWLLDGEVIEGNETLTVTMTQNHHVKPVFTTATQQEEPPPMIEPPPEPKGKDPIFIIGVVSVCAGLIMMIPRKENEK